jgi:hypothetical protein
MSGERVSDSDQGDSGASTAKVRDSCNACSQQKIKCGREKPVCERCASKGLTCEYSVSRRNGKRTRSVPTDPTFFYGRSPGYHTADDFDNIDFAFNHQDPTMFTNENTINCTPAAREDIATQNYFDPHAFDNFNQTVADFGDCILSGPNASSNSSSNASYKSTDMPICQSLPTFFESRLSDDVQLTRPDPLPSGLQSPGLSDRRILSQQQLIPARHSVSSPDCTSIALQITSGMHVASKTCMASRSSVPENGRQNLPEDDSHEINAVLHRNREAIQHLSRVLECPCSLDTSCILACYLAMFKLCAWYAAAAGLDSSHFPDIADLVVVARPIFMGSIALNNDTQRLVRASVVLQEIRAHAQPLAARLTKNRTPEGIASEATTAISPEALAASTYANMLDHRLSLLCDGIGKIIARAN